MCDRMEIQHCCDDNPERYSEKRHILPFYLSPRYQACKEDPTTNKRHLKPLAGGTSFEFGESMSGEEALSLLKPRPGKEDKMKELLGNIIFEGPFALKEDCCGMGSDKTGRCPPRPASASKASELQGHDIFTAFSSPYHYLSPPPMPPYEHEVCFPPDNIRGNRPVSSSKVSELQGHDVFEAFSNPYQYPSPPPVRPYEPDELRLPPEKIHRNPEKMSSHFRIGPPERLAPAPPRSTSAWAKQKMLYGSMDMDTDSYPKPVVSCRKARELAGHTNLFGTPPSCSPPPTPVSERCEIVNEGPKENAAETARQVHKTKMQALNGHNAVFLMYDPCRKQELQPQQPLVSYAKTQELRGNDIFADGRPHTVGTVCRKLYQCHET